MKKVLIYGAGRDYLRRRQLLEYEKYKKNIECVAICSKDHFANIIDGMPLVGLEEINNIAYEYVLVFSDEHFMTIKNQLTDRGIPGNIILSSSILEIYGFDFNDYVFLIENPITIVTQDCFAAGIYSLLKLRFTSPFILTAVDEDDFLNIVENYNSYMQSDFTLLTEADHDRGEYATAKIGGEKDSAIIKLYHYKDYAEAKEAWNRRKQRVNDNNILYIFRSSSKENIYRFVNCKCPGRKICFTPIQEYANGDEIVYIPRYTWRIEYKPDLYGYNFGDYLRNSEWLSHGVDVLKMLVGKDFVREL